MSNGRVFRYAYITMRFRQGRFSQKISIFPGKCFGAMMHFLIFDIIPDPVQLSTTHMGKIFILPLKFCPCETIFIYPIG
jgi:hypothetical protein